MFINKIKKLLSNIYVLVNNPYQVPVGTLNRTFVIGRGDRQFGNSVSRYRVNTDSNSKSSDKRIDKISELRICIVSSRGNSSRIYTLTIK